MIRIHEATRTGRTTPGPVPEAIRVRPADRWYDSTGGHRHAHTHPGLEYPRPTTTTRTSRQRREDRRVPPAVVVTSGLGSARPRWRSRACRAGGIVGRKHRRQDHPRRRFPRAGRRPQYFRGGLTPLTFTTSPSGVPPSGSSFRRQLAAARRISCPHFWYVLSRVLDADPEVVTTDVYRSVIDAACHVAGPGGLVVSTSRSPRRSTRPVCTQTFCCRCSPIHVRTRGLLQCRRSSTTGCLRHHRDASPGSPNSGAGAGPGMSTDRQQGSRRHGSRHRRRDVVPRCESSVGGRSPRSVTSDAGDGDRHFSGVRPDVAVLDCRCYRHRHAIFDAESHPERHAGAAPPPGRACALRFRCGGG